jgi:hypothetical protein
MTTTNEPLAAETGIVLRAGRGHRLRRLAMTYGHAERNLAFIRQLEAETRQLTVRSAVGRVPPSDRQLQGDDETASAFSQARPDLDESPARRP